MDGFLKLVDKAMAVWHTLLDSLATAGGNIFVLLLIWMVSGISVVRMLTHQVALDESTKGAIHDVFVGINGALMYALTQRSKGVVPPDPKDPNAPPTEDPNGTAKKPAA